MPILPRIAKTVKWLTGAVTVLFCVLTVDVSSDQADPVQKAMYRFDSVTPDGRVAGSYLRVKLAAGLKVVLFGAKL